MGSITFKSGNVCHFDDDDIEIISIFRWKEVSVGKTTYSYTTRDGKTLYMHRYVMGEPKGLIDHKDTHGLNNRKSNLRACSQAQNLMNRPKKITNTSGYKGVCWDKSRNKWHASIGFNGKLINLGRFVDKEEAARAYDKAALIYHGEYAFLNFCESPQY